MNHQVVKTYALIFITFLALTWNDVAIAAKKNKPPRGFKTFETRQLDTAWINPKFNASNYKTMTIEWLDFDYRQGKDKFKVTDSNENYNLSEQSKNALKEQARDIFAKQLAQSKNFELIELDKANTDTLVIQLTLLDIINKVPERHQIVGSTDLFLREFGAITLNVEVFDSARQQMFFKGQDREEIETFNFILERADMVTSRRFSRALLQRWARGLRKNIDDM
jgi:hypothetical protein